MQADYRIPSKDLGTIWAKIVLGLFKMVRIGGRGMRPMQGRHGVSQGRHGIRKIRSGAEIIGHMARHHARMA